MDILFTILKKILYYLPYIGLVVYVVRILILRKAPVPTPKGKKLTRELLTGCVDQLIKCDRLVTDEYTVNPDILEALNNNRTDPDVLRQLLNDISAHVGVNGELFSLDVINSVVSDRAGEIRTGLGRTKITLDLKDEYDTDTVISVMAHEVMHQCLYLNGISRKDKWENEILTDTSVVYCGFYTYMYRGYAIKHGFNPFAYTKVGYISQKEINIIQEYIDSLR